MLLKWGGCKASFQKVGDTCKTSILRKNLSSSNFSRLPFGEGFKSAHSLCSKINITREWMDNTIMTRRISAVDKVDKNGKKKKNKKHNQYISTSIEPKKTSNSINGLLFHSEKITSILKLKTERWVHLFGRVPSNPLPTPKSRWVALKAFLLDSIQSSLKEKEET